MRICHNHYYSTGRARRAWAMTYFILAAAALVPYINKADAVGRPRQPMQHQRKSFKESQKLPRWVYSAGSPLEEINWEDGPGTGDAMDKVLRVDKLYACAKKDCANPRDFSAADFNFFSRRLFLYSSLE